MPSLEFVVLALATWRMASLLAHEDGPGDVFTWLRHVLGVRYDEDSNLIGENWLAKGVLCLWCNSVWIGAVWTVLVVLLPWTWWLALPFGLSTAAIALERWIGT